MDELQTFRPGLPPADVDACLRRTLAVLDRARECAVLWFGEIVRRELYRDLGYASAHQYAHLALGFSRNRTNQFLRLAGDLERLPKLRAAVADGTIGWTKAQQVARVATPGSDGDWVDKARATTRKELAQEIKVQRGLNAKGVQASLDLPAAAVAFAPAEPPPTLLNFRLTAVDLARYEGLTEMLKKQGLVRPEATREEVLLIALAHLAEGSPVRRRTGASPYQVVIYECEHCKRAHAVTRGGDRPVTESEHAAIDENAVVIRNGRPVGSGVTPRLRRFVLSRDRFRCRAPGCGSNHYLELHHIVPQDEGGPHSADNLVTLCSRCHRYLHEHPNATWAQGLLSTTRIPTNSVGGNGDCDLGRPQPAPGDVVEPA